MELRIYNQEDRLTVAQILIKNGYWCAQGKRQKPGTKTVEYVLKVNDDDENTSTAAKKGD